MPAAPFGRRPPHAPPPLASSPSPPRIARPPSPPPFGVSVRADAGCTLGGSARVLPGATGTSVRIAVTLDNWIDGYLVTLGVDGVGLASFGPVARVHKHVAVGQRRQRPVL